MATTRVTIDLGWFALVWFCVVGMLYVNNIVPLWVLFFPLAVPVLAFIFVLTYPAWFAVGGVLMSGMFALLAGIAALMALPVIAIGKLSGKAGFKNHPTVEKPVPPKPIETPMEEVNTDDKWTLL